MLNKQVDQLVENLSIITVYVNCSRNKGLEGIKGNRGQGVRVLCALRKGKSPDSQNSRAKRHILYFQLQFHYQTLSNSS